MRQLTIRFPAEFNYSTSSEVEIQFAEALASLGLRITMWHDLQIELSRLYRDGVDAQFLFDLTNTTYVAFEQLATLHVLGTFCFRATHSYVLVRFPEFSRLVNRFLFPYNFFDFFADWGTTLTPIKDPADDLPLAPLLPLTRIATFNDVQHTASVLKKPKYERAMQKHFQVTDAQRNRLVDTIISEVCDNIPFHSGSDGLIAIQAHVAKPNIEVPKDYKPNVDILVCDCGVGILQTLRTRDSKYARASSISALNDVFDGNVPKPGGRMRGGLSRVRAAVRQFDGVFEIQTPFAIGTALRQSQPSYRGRPYFFPGTHVLLKIPLPHAVVAQSMEGDHAKSTL